MHILLSCMSLCVSLCLGMEIWLMRFIRHFQLIVHDLWQCLFWQLHSPTFSGIVMLLRLQDIHMCDFLLVHPKMKYMHTRTTFDLSPIPSLLLTLAALFMMYAAFFAETKDEYFLLDSTFGWGKKYYVNAYNGVI